MTALPKKKLCWNCEGNISRELDNCPYCGVYVHSSDTGNSNYWSPSYTPQDQLEEAPSPLYSVQDDVFETVVDIPAEVSSVWAPIFLVLKKEVFPVLFLMSGSIFFLFGLILFLFARDSTLNLRWDGSLWPVFTLLSLPSLWIGWRFLNGLEDDGVRSSSKIVAQLNETDAFNE